MVKRNRRKFIETQERGKNFTKSDGRETLQKNTVHRHPIKGLHNLGNTCYLNSIVQCLSRSPHLHELLCLPLSTKATLKRPDGNGIATLQIELIPKELPAAAHLTDLASRIRHNQNDTGTNAISPGALRELVVLKHSRFKGFGQHDCHEFLRALLDCLRQEELMIWRTGILNKFRSNENSSEKNRQMIRAWGRAASFATRVDRLFGGIIVSSLKCDYCQDVRTNFEFFLDLSIPIPENKSPIQSTPAQDVSSRRGCKTKQEMKRERRRKPERIKRKHDRARKRAELDLADDNSSEFAPNYETVDVEPVQSSEPAHTVTDVHFSDHIDNPGSDNDELPLNRVNDAAKDEESCNDENPYAAKKSANQVKLDGDLGEDIVVNTILNKPDPSDRDPTVVQTNGTNSPTPGQGSNPDCTQEVTQSSLPTRKSSFSDGSCADAEDSESIERQKTDITLVPDPSAANVADRPGGDTVSAFLAEQLKQLDLNETQSDDAASLSSRASRLAQIPLQASSLVHTSSGRKSGDGVCDLYSCLSLFTAPEHLTGPNRIVCPRCNHLPDDINAKTDSGGVTTPREPVLTEAIRRDLVLQPPALLTIHLKRFQQIGVHLQKSQKSVAFPVLLDLSPFCSVLYLSPSRSVQYRLYGVVEHMGRMAGGHYVAYVAVQTKRKAEDQGYQATRNKEMLEFVKQFVGQLDTAPKWPMTTDDLVRRWRRCDRSRLSESIEEAQSLVDDMLTSSITNGNAPVDLTSWPSEPTPDLADTDEGESTAETRMWFRCSDEHISQVPLSTVLACQAYVLFYERIK